MNFGENLLFRYRKYVLIAEYEILAYQLINLNNMYIIILHNLVCNLSMQITH